MIAVVAVTALMAFFALSRTNTRSGVAFHQITEDLQLHARVRENTLLLADATRRFLVDSTDVYRSRLAQLQRELDPIVERLVARAVELRVPDSRRLERDIDSHIAWISAVAAERIPLIEFERALQSRSAELTSQLDAFARAAREHGGYVIAKADRLSTRAQLGILFTSAMATVLALMLGRMVSRSRQFG